MKSKVNKTSVWHFIRDYFIITLGLFIYTSGVILFVLPNKLVSGGVSGMGAIIEYTTGIPIAYSFFVINLVLLVIAIKILGKGFGVKTIYAIFIASLFYKIVPALYTPEFVEAIAITNGPLLAAMMAGAMTGLGIGLSFSVGGSTGGTDIIALIVNKYRSITPGKIILLIDIVTITSSLLLPGEVNFAIKIANMMYGYVIIAVCGYTVDLFMSGTKQSVQMFIFSKHFAEIADMITPTGRGVTVLDGEGWYTKQEGKILMVIVRKTEMPGIFRQIKQIDPEAFISVGNVMGVYGKGFDKIKK